MPASKPTVLIVEDDPYISMEMQFLVEECDCRTLGPAASVAVALGMIGDQEPSAALLDINLDGEMVWPLADALDERRIPYVLVSGFRRANLPERFAERPFLCKPVHRMAVQRELSALGLCVGYTPEGGPGYSPFASRHPPRRPPTKH